MNLLYTCTFLIALPLAMQAAAQSHAPVRVDTVLYAGDLDGDSRPDSLVIETRAGKSELRPARTALYLSTAPGRTAAFTTKWDEFSGTDTEVLTVLKTGHGGTLVVIDEAEADFDGFAVLFITRGKATVVARHGIDYGNGTFTLQRVGGRITLEAAPTDNVRLKGLPVVRPLQCRPGSQAILTSIFDEAHGVFTTSGQRCPKVTED